MTPALSFVIPLYNSEATIAGLVKTIEELSIAGGHELILVDDGSADDTVAVCRELVRQARIPITLVAKLRNSHFLFLGYSLRDWNLRVILHRIWNERKLSYKSWAIQLDSEPLEQEIWHNRGVEVLEDVSLDAYVAALGERVRELLPAPGGA